MSQPALATITEVLPLPAAATTRLRSSSVTTALRCSSVSGRLSIRSKNPFSRVSSFSTNILFASTLVRSGAARKACSASSVRMVGCCDSLSGQRLRNPLTASLGGLHEIRSGAHGHIAGWIFHLHQAIVSRSDYIFSCCNLLPPPGFPRGLDGFCERTGIFPCNP